MSLVEVGAFAGGLANVTVGLKWNRRTWMVEDRGFCWERPLGKADLARFGEITPPTGDIVAVTTEDLDAKDALLAMELPGVFTIEHFRSYPAILVELRIARPSHVRALIETAWRVVSERPAPRKRAPRPRPRKRAR